MSSRNLLCGVFMPPYHANDEDVTLAMERDFELVEWLDKLGFAEAWIGEHHTGGYEVYGSPELFIAAAAVRTRNIRLGTGVISLPYHNPFNVADRMVQLDHQTRGRAMFGIGPGLLVADALKFGINPDTQRERMAEGLDIVLRLLNGETITAASDWYNLRNASLQLEPYTRPRPHVAVASAITPSGGKLAGKYGLGMLCVAANSVAGYDVLDLNWQMANEAAAAHGRQMNRSELRLVAPIHVAETRQQAVEDLKWGFDKWMHYSTAINPDGPGGIGLGSVDSMVEKGTAGIGTPDDVVQFLERFWIKTGGFGVMLSMCANWANFEATKKSYELLARYVLPKFNGRNVRRDASLSWMRSNAPAFSAASKGAAQKTIEKHFAERNVGSPKAAE